MQKISAAASFTFSVRPGGGHRETRLERGLAWAWALSGATGLLPLFHPNPQLSAVLTGRLSAPEGRTIMAWLTASRSTWLSCWQGEWRLSCCYQDLPSARLYISPPGAGLGTQGGGGETCCCGTRRFLDSKIHINSLCLGIATIREARLKQPNINRWGEV